MTVLFINCLSQVGENVIVQQVHFHIELRIAQDSLITNRVTS